MAQKKEIERFYLDKFLALLGIVPDDICEGEAPDFIISLQGKKTGIEITEYHSGAKDEDGRPRRAIENNWGQLQKVIMGEVERYEELSGTNGLLFFKKLELPSKSQYRKFTDELIQFSIIKSHTKSFKQPLFK